MSLTLFYDICPDCGQRGLFLWPEAKHCCKTMTLRPAPMIEDLSTGGLYFQPRFPIRPLNELFQIRVHEPDRIDQGGWVADIKCLRCSTVTVNAISMHMLTLWNGGYLCPLCGIGIRQDLASAIQRMWDAANIVRGGRSKIES